jgi:hypothetical protein
VSTDLKLSIFLKADELPDKDMFAWCDRNPHNGHIYTCAFEVPTHLRAFAESPAGTLIRRPEHDIPLIHPVDYRPTTRVQGGCFTPRHKWLAVCDDSGFKKFHDPTTWWVERIHCHSTLNGAFLGRRLLPAKTDESGSLLPTSTRNELEDIWLYPLTATNGQPVHVHVLELNNEELSPDDFYLWHFTVPHPTAL